MHIHFTLKTEAAQSSETVVTYYITTRRHKPEHYDFKGHRSIIYFTLKMEAACSTETLVTYHIMTRCRNPADPDLLRFHGFPLFLYLPQFLVHDEVFI
jgi:hypothetical protein